MLSSAFVYLTYYAAIGTIIVLILYYLASWRITGIGNENSIIRVRYAKVKYLAAINTYRGIKCTAVLSFLTAIFLLSEFKAGYAVITAFVFGILIIALKSWKGYIIPSRNDLEFVEIRYANSLL